MCRHDWGDKIVPLLLMLYGMGTTCHVSYKLRSKFKLDDQHDYIIASVTLRGCGEL